jgi:hypothetical protein
LNKAVLNSALDDLIKSFEDANSKLDDLVAKAERQIELIFQTGREQNTVRGILRLNGHWVQGSPLPPRAQR